MRSRVWLLALVAVLAVTLAALIAPREHAARAPARSPRPPHGPQPGRPDVAPRPSRADADLALAVARSYALAARNWTAASYPAAWRHQLALAGGKHGRQLRRARPTPAQLAALRADRASNLAVVTRAWRDPAVNPPAARILVWLDERTETSGQALAATTVNELGLHETHGRWRVTGFTILPARAAP